MRGNGLPDADVTASDRTDLLIVGASFAGVACAIEPRAQDCVLS